VVVNVVTKEKKKDKASGLTSSH